MQDDHKKTKKVPRKKVQKASPPSAIKAPTKYRPEISPSKYFSLLPKRKNYRTYGYRGHQAIFTNKKGHLFPKTRFKYYRPIIRKIRWPHGTAMH